MAALLPGDAQPKGAKPISVLVCGSRSPRNPFAASILVSEMVAKLTPGMVILNGGARGIDEYVLHHVRELPHGHVIDLGTDWTAPHTVPPPPAVTAIVFRPKWKQDGRRAVVLRNLFMLDLKPEMVVACWNGISGGTGQVIQEARRRKIETVVIDA